MKNAVLLIIMILLTAPTSALANEDTFLARIHSAKMLVTDHDPRSVEDILRELQKTSSAEGNLQIYEAVAATYRDLVVDKNVIDEADQKNLYDQIRMNVAFIQFGGDPNYSGGKKINRWIRQTLMKYLPRDLINDETIFHSAEEWKK